MQRQLKALAPYISVFGLALLVASLVMPALAQRSGATIPQWLGTALAVAGAVLALAWPFLRPEDIRAFFRQRRARYGTNTLVMVVAVLGILGALNFFFGYQNYYVRDLTTNKRFSVSNQTIQILDQLDERGQTVQLTSLLDPRDNQSAADLEKLIDRYRQHTDRVTYERLDPQIDLPKVLALGQRIGSEGGPPGRALVAESGERHAIVYSFDEQAVTEAIVKATRDKERTVAFITGHGEHDPNGGGTDGRGYSVVRQALEREGYTVKTQSLTGITGTLEADAVVVAGPRRKFLPEEAELLADYVSHGGGALVLVDPEVDAGLEPVLDPWKIGLNRDIVLATNALFGSASTTVPVSAYEFHTITKDLSGFTTALVNARSLAVEPSGTSTLVTTPLIKLGAEGDASVWGETDLAALQSRQAQADPVDTAAPLTVAVAGEGGEATGRLVVFGTGNLASDGILQQLGRSAVANGDLMLNAVNWLAQDEDLISIRPTEPDNHELGAPQRPWLFFLTIVVFLPLLMLAIGLAFHWQRR